MENNNDCICSITDEYCEDLELNHGNCVGCSIFDSWAIGTEW